jgi:hypothetical protein
MRIALSTLTMQASPYAGAIVPRREVRVTVDGVRVITTTIDDWNYSYSPDGSSRAEIIATDEFTLLGPPGFDCWDCYPATVWGAGVSGAGYVECCVACMISAALMRVRALWVLTCSTGTRSVFAEDF